jgi:hypothetical protein
LLSILEGTRLLATRGLFATDRIEEIATLIGLLVSNDSYLHFRDAGWSDERYVAWLQDSLNRLRR